MQPLYHLNSFECSESRHQTQLALHPLWTAAAAFEYKHPRFSCLFVSLVVMNPYPHWTPFLTISRKSTNRYNLTPLWSRHCRSSVPPGDRTASTSAAARPQSDRAPQRRRAEAAGVPEAPRLAGATQLTQSQLRCHFEEELQKFWKIGKMSQGTDAALAQLPT